MSGGPDPAARLGGGARDSTGGELLLATGILGATVMPHVIYLHGSLTQDRYGRAHRAATLGLMRSQRLDVISAMSLAGLVNVIMLVVAARVLSTVRRPSTTIEAAHQGLGAALGSTAAVLFGLALLASGFAASGVGTLSGQVIMQGFLQPAGPPGRAALVTLAPALAVIAVGVDVTKALVFSQVVLSFGIPFALVPLVMVTRRRT